MAEENNAAAEGQAGAQFGIQRIYVKDISFEAPNSPAIFTENGQADVNLNMSQKANPVGEDAYEVVLTLTVTAKLGEKTAYLAEIQQAGIFHISGMDEANLHGVIGTVCPNTLFPYARQSIGDLVSQGGFPALMLQPIDFNQLYRQQLQQQQAAAAEQAEAGTSH